MPAAEAGPDAVGILVPPGRRTVVVLRPRALDFDLLLVRRSDDGAPLASFHEAGRAEAEMLATNLGKAFSAGGSDRTDVVPTTGGSWVQVEIGAFALVVCPRTPGQAYRPLLFSSSDDARQVATALAAALSPGADANRDLYFNTQHFAR